MIQRFRADPAEQDIAVMVDREKFQVGTFKYAQQIALRGTPERFDGYFKF